MRVELLLAPDCPNTSPAKVALNEALRELALTVSVLERVGDFPAPTVLIDGVDVVNDNVGAPQMQACRLDVPTVPKLFAALRRSTANRSGSPT
ncbi:alkylmercury lyase [Lentzea sp. HUAS TT2]|uniref:alkylmercury lyase n=1 Tax=Lentzea sp. HUAS TT2 TaxID=3447454 RepID=UPI003F6F79CB